MHLLHARVTRDFRGADPDVVLSVDAVLAASVSCRSNTGPIAVVAVTAVSDSLERSGDELLRPPAWVCAAAVLSTVSL